MSDNELTYPGGRLRLFVDDPLRAGNCVVPDEQQTHYLLHVMRAKAGDRVNLFNGSDGEWVARLTGVSKRSCSLECERRLRPQSGDPDLWLCFAPIKKTPADYVVQKATELGVAVLQPVFTRRTIVSRVNLERMRANAVEAAEQSERLTIPDCREPLSFDKLLANWPRDRRLFFCDEGGDALPIAEAVRNPPPLVEEGGEVMVSASPVREIAPEPAAIFTGPEGGFDDRERETLRALPFVTPVTLGPRILRADTAALAALTIWQSVKGDWRSRARLLRSTPYSAAFFCAYTRRSSDVPVRSTASMMSSMVCQPIAFCGTKRSSTGKWVKVSTTSPPRASSSKVG